MRLFFVRVSQPLEGLIDARDRGRDVVRVNKRALQFLERDVRILMDQLDQKVMVRGKPSMTCVARVRGRGQA